MTVEPWLAVSIAAAVGLLWMVAAVRRRHRPQRDPQRTFTRAQRQHLARRAGNQCEHKPLIGRRCRQPGIHGDHIWPHSKGGATVLPNGQAMCAKHNLRKSDRVPSRLYIWRLQRRRQRYFPNAEPVQVVWQLGAPAPQRRRPSST